MKETEEKKEDSTGGERQVDSAKKSKFALPKKERELSEENALPQVIMLLDRYGVDIEAIEDEKIKANQEAQAQKILSFIKSGDVEIYDEDGRVKVKQYIRHRSENGNVEFLVYDELEGHLHQSLRIHKDANGFEGIHELLGIMCETKGAKTIIKNVRASDLRIAEELGTFFL